MGFMPGWKGVFALSAMRLRARRMLICCPGNIQGVTFKENIKLLKHPLEESLTANLFALGF